jgi:acetyl-CoA carboxylase biotin carboxyl carrier protein
MSVQRIQPIPHEISPDSMGESGVGFGFRLIVAPVAGRLRHLPPARFHQGEEWVSAGQPVALVEHGTASHEVRSPIEGKVAGVLVRDGEPVQAGQPVVWLMPGGPSGGPR